jgi:hypothetical protein
VLTAALVNVLGDLVGIQIAHEQSAPLWPSAMASAVGALVVLILFATRRHTTTRLTSALFLLNSASVTAAFALTDPVVVQQSPLWAPFQAEKLGALVAALLAPSFFTGVITILGHVLTPLIQLQTFAPEIRQHFAQAEPWTVVAFGVVAILLLGFRFARARLEDKVVAAEAEVRATRDLAQKIMAIKDRLNSPLQTLDIGMALLRPRGAADPELADLVERLDRAVASLATTSRALAKYEPMLGSDRRTLSFDALEVVEPQSGPADQAPKAPVS